MPHPARPLSTLRTPPHGDARKTRCQAACYGPTRIGLPPTGHRQLAQRTCTDHIVALSERHLTRALAEYVDYYNASRTHLSLDGDAPIPRRRESTPAFHLQATPVLGGLHHRYARAA
jgi:hypothetical protein